MNVTRLSFGTGSISGKVQRELGQEQFNRLIRYAYDNGIRFFEAAESYEDMHRMLEFALRGIPRDSYRLMSKVTTKPGVERRTGLRKPSRRRSSWGGEPPYADCRAPEDAGKKWLGVAVIRMNHMGKSMEAGYYHTSRPGNLPEVVTHVEEVHKESMGVISMKLVGEGTFTNREDRKAAMRFASGMRELAR